MAKDGSLSTHNLDAPDAVQAGETFQATLTIRLTATSIDPEDKNRCSIDAYCDGDEGYCIRPFAVSPVDGTIMADPTCITTPESGATDMDITFTLTAPDKFAKDDQYDYSFGWQFARGAPWVGGKVSGSQRGKSLMQSVGEEIRKSIVIGNRTEAGGNEPPSDATIERAEYTNGGIRLTGNAVDPDGEITAYSWVLFSQYRGEYTRKARGSGQDTIIPFDKSAGGNAAAVLFAHDSSGNITQTDTGISGDISETDGIVPASKRDLIGTPGRNGGSGGGGGIGAGVDGRTLALIAAAGGAGLLGLAAASR